MTTRPLFHPAAETVLAILLGPFLCAPRISRAQMPAASGNIISIAGNGSLGFSGDDGPALNARMGEVNGLAVGADGTLYIADSSNYRIRAVNPATGIIRTIAGTGDPGDEGNNGPATSATLGFPIGLATDRSRNALYLTEFDNHWVRKVNLNTGILTAYAGTGEFGSAGDGGPATLAKFRFPVSAAADGAGNFSVIDTAPFLVRRVNAATGIIMTIAGNGGSGYTGDGGPATSASCPNIIRLTADFAGNVFVRDGDPNAAYFTVRRIDAVTGIITTIVGGGTNPPGAGVATTMHFDNIAELAANDAGELFVATPLQVFKLNIATGLLAPFAGDGTNGFNGDGVPALTAKFANITALTVVPGGGLVIADTDNGRIRYVAPESINLSGDSSVTEFHLPWVGSLSGDLIFTHNTNTGVVNLGSLDSVGGNLSLNENTSAAGVNLAGLDTVGGSLSLNDNTSASVVNLAELDTVGGSLSLNDNTSASEVNLAELDTVGGNLSLNDNTSAAEVNLGSLTDVKGDVTIENNAPNAQVDLGSLTEYGCGAIPWTMKLNGGTILIPAGLTLCDNAILTGSTTLKGNVTNRGRIEPGSSPGRLNITGNLTLASESRLGLEMGGFAAGQFDVVSATGTVALGGTLSLKLLTPFPGAVPAATSLTVISAGSPLTGAFSNIASGATLTTADAYARCTVRYAGENTVRLTDIVIVDTDSDTLPDWWEDQFGLNKASAADAALDADSDGNSNIQEWLAGTDPGDAGSVLEFVSNARTPAGLTFTAATSLLREYTLERKSSLTDAFGTVETTPGTGGDVTFTDPAPPGTRSFYRIRAGIPTP